MAVDQQNSTSLAPDALRRRFAFGALAQEFKASLPDGGARLTKLESLVHVDKSASVLGRLDEDLNILGIVEGWCRDSLDGSAVLLHLAGDRPNIRVRFFIRGDNPDLMAAYRKDGQYDSIPVLLFLDNDFHEIGRYIERPDALTDMYRAHRTEMAERDAAFAPADAPLRSFDDDVRQRLRSALDELRERDRDKANAVIASALDAIAARSGGQS
jgi:hypothetical protein